MTGESLFINNDDLCLMSAAKPSRNNPFPSPGSAEQLPFPWPSLYCCRAGQHKQWSCTCCQACQNDGGAITRARRNGTIKYRCAPLLAQLFSPVLSPARPTTWTVCLTNPLSAGLRWDRALFTVPSEGRWVFHERYLLLDFPLLGDSTPLVITPPNRNFRLESCNFGAGSNHWNHPNSQFLKMRKIEALRC